MYSLSHEYVVNQSHTFKFSIMCAVASRLTLESAALTSSALCLSLLTRFNAAVSASGKPSPPMSSYLAMSSPSSVSPPAPAPTHNRTPPKRPYPLTCCSFAVLASLTRRCFLANRHLYLRNPLSLERITNRWTSTERTETQFCSVGRRCCNQVLAGTAVVANITRYFRFCEASSSIASKRYPGILNLLWDVTLYVLCYLLSSPRAFSFFLYQFTPIAVSFSLRYHALSQIVYSQLCSSMIVSPYTKYCRH